MNTLVQYSLLVFANFEQFYVNWEKYSWFVTYKDNKHTVRCKLFDDRRLIYVAYQETYQILDAEL